VSSSPGRIIGNACKKPNPSTIYCTIFAQFLKSTAQISHNLANSATHDRTICHFCLVSFIDVKDIFVRLSRFMHVLTTFYVYLLSPYFCLFCLFISLFLCSVFMSLFVLACTHRNLRKAKIFHLVKKTAKVWLLW
jgi:hypothetical protein